MPERKKRAAVLVDDPSQNNRLSVKLAPRLRDRGFSVFVPALTPGHMLEDSEESASEAASCDPEYCVIGFSAGAPVACRIAERHMPSQLVLIAPALTDRALSRIQDTTLLQELTGLMLTAARDAYLIASDTLILWPGDDPDCPVRDARRFLSRIPSGEASLLPGARTEDLVSSAFPEIVSRLFSFFDRDQL